MYSVHVHQADRRGECVYSPLVLLLNTITRHNKLVYNSIREAYMYPVLCFVFLRSSPSSLFADVVNCMQTDNLELKKLVYLYLMNYAKSQPDLAILAVNTFSKVCCVPACVVCMRMCVCMCVCLLEERMRLVYSTLEQWLRRGYSSEWK